MEQSSRLFARLVFAFCFILGGIRCIVWVSVYVELITAVSFIVLPLSASLSLARSLCLFVYYFANLKYVFGLLDGISFNWDYHVWQ